MEHVCVLLFFHQTVVTFLISNHDGAKHESAYSPPSSDQPYLTYANTQRPQYDHTLDHSSYLLGILTQPNLTYSSRTYPEAQALEVDTWRGQPDQCSISCLIHILDEFVDTSDRAIWTTTSNAGSPYIRHRTGPNSCK